MHRTDEIPDQTIARITANISYGQLENVVADILRPITVVSLLSIFQNRELLTEAERNGLKSYHHTLLEKANMQS